MKKLYLATLVIMAAALIAMPSVAQANLLTNAGFEDGNPGGWFDWNTSQLVVTTPVHSGSYSDKVSLVGPTEGAPLQELTTGWSVGDPIYADAWIKTDAGLSSANARIRIEFIDGATPILESTVLSGTNDWTHISLNTTIPSGTTMVKYLMKLEDGDTGDYAYFDDNYLDTSPIPEPASLLLFGSGLMGLFGFGMRKKKK